MKRSLSVWIGVVVFVLSVLASTTLAQVDEISNATGLPIPIGEPVIYGQVTIRGLPRDERKPTVVVALVDNGVPIDRQKASDSGYYYFLRRPQVGFVLLFEIDGKEIGRAAINDGLSSRQRQDISVDWQTINGMGRTMSGTVSARNAYDRPADAEKNFAKAKAAISGPNYKEAIALLRSITDKYPQDFPAWTLMGSVYIGDGNSASGSDALNKALEIKPDYAPALINLGNLEIDQKNFDKAIGHLSRAVELEPESPVANRLLGEAYLRIKKGSLAVGYLNKSIELAPIENAEVHLRLAALYNAAGLKDRAVAEYKAFLAKVKDHPEKERIEKYIKENSTN